VLLVALLVVVMLAALLAAGVERRICQTLAPGQQELNTFLLVMPRVCRDDLLIWIQGNQLGTFSRRQVTGEIKANWLPA